MALGRLIADNRHLHAEMPWGKFGIAEGALRERIGATGQEVGRPAASTTGASPTGVQRLGRNRKDHIGVRVFVAVIGVGVIVADVADLPLAQAESAEVRPGIS